LYSETAPGKDTRLSVGLDGKTHGGDHIGDSAFFLMPLLA